MYLITATIIHAFFSSLFAITISYFFYRKLPIISLRLLGEILFITVAFICIDVFLLEYIGHIVSYFYQSPFLLGVDYNPDNIYQYILGFIIAMIIIPTFFSFISSKYITQNKYIISYVLLIDLIVIITLLAGYYFGYINIYQHGYFS